MIHHVLALNTWASQDISYLFPLLLTVVAADVGYARNACAEGSSCTGFAVLDCNTFFRFDTDDFAGMKVDGWVRFGGGFLQAGRSTEDEGVREEMFLPSLGYAGTDTSEC